MNWTPDVVIYHDPCLDGFTAAWAAHTAWPDADFIGSNYGVPPPEVADKNVLIVDFSYKRAELEELAARARSIVILDHHKSAMEDLAPFRRFKDKPERFTLPVITSMLEDLIRNGYPAICALFDMERSGARLSWDFARGWEGLKAPAIVRLVEDRDLWRFDLEVTKAFSLALMVQSKTWDNWYSIAEDLDLEDDLERAEIVEQGRAMLAFHDWLVEKIAGRAEFEPIDGFDVPVVDCPYELASEVGDLLCRLWPDAKFSAMRSISSRGTSYSLRSRNGFDVSSVAVKFGGGGHAGASGFRIEKAGSS